MARLIEDAVPFTESSIVFGLSLTDLGGEDDGDMGGEVGGEVAGEAIGEESGDKGE